jgi:hypothetical protein
MEWKSIPFKEHPRKTIFLITFLLLMWTGIYFSFRLYGLFISILLLGGGLLPYWLPTYYFLDEKGVRVKGIFLEKNKRWDEFKSYYEDKNGVFLSPFSKPTRIENFRGLYIRFNNNKEEVIKFISSHIKTPLEHKS